MCVFCAVAQAVKVLVALTGTCHRDSLWDLLLSFTDEQVLLVDLDMMWGFF